MSIPSSDSLQMQSDSESMPTSDGHHPLPGETDFVSWSEEDIANVVAVLRGDQLSPEVHVQSDASLNDSEESLLDAHKNTLAGPADAQVDESNNDELPMPQQGTSTSIEHVENAQASFPILENFTTPVAGLPQVPQTDGNIYCPPQPSADLQAPAQDDALPQDEYDAGDAMGGPPSEDYTQPSAGVQTAPQGYGWPQLGYHPAPFYPGQQPQTVAGPPFPYHQHQIVAGPLFPYQQPQIVAGPPFPYQQPQTVAGPPYPHQQPQTVTGLPYPFQQPQTVAGPFNPNYTTGPFPQGHHAPLQMASGGGSGSTVQPPSTGFVERHKHRARYPVLSGNPTYYILQRPLKRRRPNRNENAPGKFGPYTLADASATVMPMPLHDPQPVDISNRRTHDPYGNPLRTRRFGVMELEYFPDASDNVTDHQPPGLICVRPCDWSKDPCGLFIEMDQMHVEDHLWFWHGVTMENPTCCQFKDCPEPAQMSKLSRHIEGVHFAKCFQCPYCKKLCSRGDSLRRHQLVCTALSASRQQAMEGGYDFHLKKGVESMQGYIVPAQSAT